MNSISLSLSCLTQNYQAHDRSGYWNSGGTAFYALTGSRHTGEDFADADRVVAAVE
jgi:hypothetical protein